MICTFKHTNKHIIYSSSSYSSSSSSSSLSLFISFLFHICILLFFYLIRASHYGTSKLVQRNCLEFAQSLVNTVLDLHLKSNLFGKIEWRCESLNQLPKWKKKTQFLDGSTNININLACNPFSMFLSYIFCPYSQCYRKSFFKVMFAIISPGRSKTIVAICVFVYWANNLYTKRQNNSFLKKKKRTNRPQSHRYTEVMIPQSLLNGNIFQANLDWNCPKTKKK